MERRGSPLPIHVQSAPPLSKLTFPLPNPPLYTHPPTHPPRSTCSDPYPYLIRRDPSTAAPVTSTAAGIFVLTQV